MVDEKQSDQPVGPAAKPKLRSPRTSVQLLVALLILISGAIIGSGGTVMFIKLKMPWIGHRPKKTAASIAEKIKQKYNLDEEQCQRVETILNDAFLKRESLHKEIDKEFEAADQIFIAEMKKVLTEEQFQKWHQDFQARKEKFKKRFKDKD